MLLPLVASLGYGVANFFGGLASRRQHAAMTLLLSQATAFIMVLGWAQVKHGEVGAIHIGILAGCVAFIGAWTAYTCFSIGRPIGIAAAILSATSTIVPVSWGLLHGQRPNLPAAIGLGLSVVAIGVLFTPDATQRRTDLLVSLLALVAGFAFGSYHVIMSHTRRVTGWWPAVASQSAILVLSICLVIILWSVGRIKRPTLHGAGLSVGDGVASTIATIFALPAVWGGKLPIVGTLIALAPAVTTALSWLIAHDPMPRRGAIGLVLAMTAAIMLTAPAA